MNRMENSPLTELKEGKEELPAILKGITQIRERGPSFLTKKHLLRGKGPAQLHRGEKKKEIGTD